MTILWPDPTGVSSGQCSHCLPVSRKTISGGGEMVKKMDKKKDIFKINLHVLTGNNCFTLFHL